MSEYVILGIEIEVWLGAALLALGLVSAGLTINAFRPIRTSQYLLVPSFLSSFITSEAPIHHIAWQAIIAAPLMWFGALAAPIGLIGIGVLALSWLALLMIFAEGHRATRVFEDALDGVPELEAHQRTPRSDLLLPLRRHRKGIRVKRNIVFREVDGRQLKLDVVFPRQPGENRPAIIQIHGGGWVIGDKREQGWPLMTHLAAHGWVCFNLNYRLSPAATFPDHLIDIKHGLRWVREHADEWDIDPSFVAVTGGSAGGHLTAMMGLTANDAEYQPGFEQFDTSVQAAIPFYGIYDFTNRLGTHHPTMIPRLLQPLVMKAFFDKEPEKYHRASPVDRVHPDAPPFFVIHGDRDTLAPVEDARAFVEKLREISSSPVYYAELPGAQHGFEVFHSVRAEQAVDAVLRFLNDVHGAHAKHQLEGAVGKSANVCNTTLKIVS